ncbi:hypothetical protein [Piscirickettsia litoralis]|uniref:DUF3168 domain-containing protein n=1 Tax=Piscirickettsia litoralis TaxID=1891921 RepID=A0ABX3A0R8_9GAMM|nr:hypothetical protein [Piscirickettsia litoralis]ODN41050.1 hypothetical protein BGC07_18650 [Piscirickettsia litoralis]
MIEADFYHALSAVGFPVFPLVLPKKQTLPAITYQVVSGRRDYELDSRPSLTKKSIQVNCMAKKHSICKMMQCKVLEVLDAHQTAVIQLITLESELDQYEQETKTYRTSLTFTVTGVI